jgi:hypothetical protein
VLGLLAEQRRELPPRLSRLRFLQEALQRIDELDGCLMFRTKGPFVGKDDLAKLIPNFVETRVFEDLCESAHRSAC